MSWNEEQYRYYGNAGTSMGDTNFLKKFGKSNTQAGKMGEVILFHKLREPHGWLKSDMPLFCSLIPDKKYKSDIDFAVVMGNKVLLIDAKMYKSGGFYWNIGNTVYRNFRPYKTEKYDKKARKRVSSPVKMSKSMDMARDRIQRLLGDNYIVESCVILVSNPSSKQSLSTTWFMRYPGNIKVFNEFSGKKFIKKFFKNQEYTKSTALAEKKLKKLVQ